MNQRKAKELRKLIYGDMSLHEKREYKENKTINPVRWGDTIIGHGQIVVGGLRRKYQQAKKLFKAK